MAVNNLILKILKHRWMDGQEGLLCQKLYALGATLALSMSVTLNFQLQKLLRLETAEARNRMAALLEAQHGHQCSHRAPFANL